jgi:hypothetical protein
MEKLDARKPRLAANPGPEHLSSSRATPSESFDTVLRRLAMELDRGERLVTRVIERGGQLSPQQLLAAQAGIYRYSETLELAAKLVDKASSAIRTTLQSQ